MKRMLIDNCIFITVVFAGDFNARPYERVAMFVANGE